MAGRDVWLVDAARQGTAQTAISIRAEAGQQPGIACATYPDGPTLRAQVQQQMGKFDDIIIDAGGRDSTALRAALVLSDVIVVPFQPRSYDVWALNDIAALIQCAANPVVYGRVKSAEGEALLAVGCCGLCMPYRNRLSDSRQIQGPPESFSP